MLWSARWRRSASAAIAYTALKVQEKTAANTRLQQLVKAAGAAEWRKGWKHEYTAYKKARDAAQYFGVLGPGRSQRELGLSSAAYGVRVARWFDQTCFAPKPPDACARLDEMHTAARNLLVGLSDPNRDEAYLDQ